MNGQPPPFHDASDFRAPQHHTSGEDALVRESSTYMSDPEAEQLCSTFADGLDSGIGYARILDMMGRQGFDSKTIDRLRSDLLERGDHLAGAFARYGILDATARRLVLVADEQGVLPETFKQLAKIYGSRHKRKRAFLSAMVEPAILIALGAIVFRNLIGAGLVDLAFADDTMDQLIDIGITAGIESAIFGLICFSAGFTWLNLPVDFAPRDIFARFWLRVPFVSDPGRLSAIGLFCRYLRQSLAGGMSVYDGLELAADAANHPYILSAMPRARAHIQDGWSLTESLSAVKALPPEVIENIDIGEEAGRLDERLEFLAERYDERGAAKFESRMKTYTTLIRYMIIIAVILMVFSSVLKIEIPI